MSKDEYLSIILWVEALHEEGTLIVQGVLKQDSTGTAFAWGAAVPSKTNNGILFCDKVDATWLKLKTYWELTRSFLIDWEVKTKSPGADVRKIYLTTSLL